MMRKFTREPDGPSPVRIAAEEPGLRLCRLIVDLMLILVESQRVGMIPMVAGEGSDPVRREKLRTRPGCDSIQIPIGPG